MALVPEIKYSEFNNLTESQIAEMKSVIVNKEDGTYLFNATVGRTDYIKVQAEYMGQLSNAVGGKDPSELVVQAVTTNEFKVPEAEHKCPVCGKVCKSAWSLSGHRRSHK